LSIGKITIYRNLLIEDTINTFALQTFTEQDIPLFKLYWDHWQPLAQVCTNAGNRVPNLAEYFTEGLVALVTGSARRVSKDYAKCIDPTVRFTPKGKKNGDNLRIQTLRAEEVKSSTIQYDCSQISPKDDNVDVIQFIHFYNDGNLDGTFDIYEFSPLLSKSLIVCKGKNETTADQQDQGRRAKNGIMKDIIIPNNILPTHSKVKLW